MLLDVGGGLEDHVLVLDVVEVEHKADELVQDRADPAVEGFDVGKGIHFLLIACAQAEYLVHIRAAVDRRAAHEHEQLTDT